MSWASEAMAFVGRHLPALLEEHGQDHEADALQALVDKYRAHRTAQMKARDEQIAANRAKVDARLREREGAGGGVEPAAAGATSAAEPDPSPEPATPEPEEPKASKKRR